MFGWEHWGVSFWWVFVLVAVAMFIGCFFTMRGCSCMTAWTGWRIPPEGSRFRWSSRDSAREILKKRFALGDIDEKTYDEMKKKLDYNDLLQERTGHDNKNLLRNDQRNANEERLRL